MDGSIKLLTVRGVNVRIHSTFPLILIWAAFQFGYLSEGGAEGALFGVIVTLLLFAIVTLHELGHSLAALRFGVGVKQIVLLPLGGVAQLERIPESPMQEFVIAIAGPAVNFVIAVLMGLIALALDIPLIDPENILPSLERLAFDPIFGYVFYSNVFLALFNLIPAFPLDGGRILRALLATRLPYVRATSVAAGIGRSFAWLLGLYGFLGGGPFIILIAFFIYIGAGQEREAVRGRSVLRGLQVKQAYSRQAISLSPRDSLLDAVNATLSSFQATFPVCEDDQLVGLLTYPALVKALSDHGPEMLVSHVMAKGVPSVSPADELVDVQQRFNESKVDAFPVVEGSTFLGLITSRDLNEVFRLVSVDPDLLPRSEVA
jgi:stage IV sporulation protein FB